MEFPFHNTNPQAEEITTIGTYILPLEYLPVCYTKLSSHLSKTVKTLQNQHYNWRRTRQGPNSFLRAVYVLYLEETIRSNKLKELIQNMKDATGIYCVRSTRHDENRKYLLQMLKKLKSSSSQLVKLQMLFRLPKFDRSFVWEIKYIIANFLKLHRNHSKIRSLFQQSSSKTLYNQILGENNTADFMIHLVAHALDMKINLHDWSQTNEYGVWNYGPKKCDIQLEILKRDEQYDMLYTSQTLSEVDYDFASATLSGVQFAEPPGARIQRVLQQLSNPAFLLFIQKLEETFPSRELMMIRKLEATRLFSYKQFAQFSVQQEDPREVYFGRVYENERCGNGLLVTPRSIIVGKWKNDVITQGYIFTISDSSYGLLSYMNGKYVLDGDGTYKSYNYINKTGTYKILTKSGRFENGYLCGLGTMTTGSFRQVGSWNAGAFWGPGQIEHTIPSKKITTVIQGKFLDQNNAEQVMMVIKNFKGKVINRQMGIYKNKQFLPQHGVSELIYTENYSAFIPGLNKPNMNSTAVNEDPDQSYKEAFPSGRNEMKMVPTVDDISLDQDQVTYDQRSFPTTYRELVPEIGDETYDLKPLKLIDDQPEKAPPLSGKAGFDIFSDGESSSEKDVRQKIEQDSIEKVKSPISSRSANSDDVSIDNEPDQLEIDALQPLILPEAFEDVTQDIGIPVSSRQSVNDAEETRLPVESDQSESEDLAPLPVKQHWKEVFLAVEGVENKAMLLPPYTLERVADKVKLLLRQQQLEFLQLYQTLYTNHRGEQIAIFDNEDLEYVISSSMDTLYLTCNRKQTEEEVKQDLLEFEEGPISNSSSEAKISDKLDSENLMWAEEDKSEKIAESCETEGALSVGEVKPDELVEYVQTQCSYESELREVFAARITQENMPLNRSQNLAQNSMNLASQKPRQYAASEECAYIQKSEEQDSQSEQQSSCEMKISELQQIPSFDFQEEVQSFPEPRNRTLRFDSNQDPIQYSFPESMWTQTVPQIPEKLLATSEAETEKQIEPPTSSLHDVAQLRPSTPMDDFVTPSSSLTRKYRLHNSETSSDTIITTLRKRSTSQDRSRFRRRSKTPEQTIMLRVKSKEHAQQDLWINLGDKVAELKHQWCQQTSTNPYDIQIMYKGATIDEE